MLRYINEFFFKFLILILFLILIYIFFRSEIYWDGKRRTYYLIYYVGTLLAIFFSLICTRINEKIQSYIIIISITSIFTLYSFEGILFFKKKTNLNFDILPIHEFFQDAKKTNLYVKTVTPNNFLTLNELNLLSLSGISKVETIFCNENNYDSIYQSDRYGFNNPDQEWDSKKIEYLLIGDSFTHGACVNRPHDIASVLRLHSKKNVLNLGQGGNGPLLEYATLREYLMPNIKNVLWLYYEGNDLADLNEELSNKILNKYLNNKEFKQNLKFKQNQIDEFLNDFIERGDKIYNAKIIKFIKLSNIRTLLLHSTPQPPTPPPPELAVILKSAKELVEANNAKLYFIYLPSFERYQKMLKIDFKQEINNIVIDLGIEFIDIDKEVFKKENNPLKLFPFERPGHYNVEGYKKVALKIYEKIK